MGCRTIEAAGHALSTVYVFCLGAVYLHGLAKANAMVMSPSTPLARNVGRSIAVSRFIVSPLVWFISRPLIFSYLVAYAQKRVPLRVTPSPLGSQPRVGPLRCHQNISFISHWIAIIRPPPSISYRPSSASSLPSATLRYFLCLALCSRPNRINPLKCGVAAPSSDLLRYQ
ncbi:hypothetical protein HDK77DRAFT_123082 [Phyllosticta capitalensis]